MSKITKVAFCLLFAFLMFCLLFGGISWIAMAFTYEGEMDPDEFTMWELVQSDMISFIKMVAIVQNPDREADVQRIQMFMYINGTLLSYRYFKGGEAYNYELNIDKDRYERRRYTDKERRACMKCHIFGSPI